MVILLTRALTLHGRPLNQEDFHLINEPGFGDRHNSWAWSMQWWRGKLYVGTNRSWECYTTLMHQTVPVYGMFVKYPPKDKDLECTPTPEDLPMQAEIWRYDPGINHWELLYQAPNDVEIPGHPGKFTARDIGYRTMTIFEEPDGSESLYVFGVTSNTVWKKMPPPRILRSTDGYTFEPVPQDPGTVLGDLNKDVERASFRSATVYNGKLYVLISGIHGAGNVLEAEYPAGGNDNFRHITPAESGFWETSGYEQVYTMATFNDFLYLGMENPSGFSIVKTDATGELPYTLTPVITNGGFLNKKPTKIPHLKPNRPPSLTPGTMHIFKNRLYLGTDKPGEVFRIHPDDTWDLVVGKPRLTPDGWKYPLSGMEGGFNYKRNHHIWRMQSHGDYLYIGTADATTEAYKNNPVLSRLFQSKMGFDLFVTQNGWSFYQITTTGFNNIFNLGLRTWASTPYGLFFGTANSWYGNEIWLGYMNSSGPSLKTPKGLDVQSEGIPVVLSWEVPTEATLFHIFRSTSRSLSEISQSLNEELKSLSFEQYADSSPTEIATVEEPFFVDITAVADTNYTYHVVAEDAVGNISEPSNFVCIPSLAPVVTFSRISNTITSLDRKGKFISQEAKKEFLRILDKAQTDLAYYELERAICRLNSLHLKVEENTWEKGAQILEPLHTEDLEILLSKLIKRVSLIEPGILSPSDLY